jgi:hypothetical protein
MTERPRARRRAHAAILSRIVVAGASASGMFGLVAVMGAAARPEGPLLIVDATVTTAPAPVTPAMPGETIAVPPPSLPAASEPPPSASSQPAGAPPASAAPPPSEPPAAAPPRVMTEAPSVPAPAPVVTEAPPAPVPASTAAPTTQPSGRTQRS